MTELPDNTPDTGSHAEIGAEPDRGPDKGSRTELGMQLGNGCGAEPDNVARTESGALPDNGFGAEPHSELGAVHRIRRYHLKPMVAARLCAEVSVFVILLALPLVLLLLGKLLGLSYTYKLIVAILCLCGLVMLPVYGFITFKVTVTEVQLTTHSLFSAHSCLLSQIKGLTRRSNWNWIRYVVEFDGGTLTFPIWLKQCDELVDFVRRLIPGGVAGKRSVVGRHFRQDTVSIAFQVGQAIAGLVFVGVVWFFAFSLYRSGSAGISAADEALVIVFALAVSAVLLWRTAVVMLMPVTIELKSDALALNTMFSKKNLPWKEIKAVKEPLPILPEGFMVHTQRGSFLIGNGMDSADELADAIKEKIAKVPELS